MTAFRSSPLRSGPPRGCSRRRSAASSASKVVRLEWKDFQRPLDRRFFDIRADRRRLPVLAMSLLDEHGAERLSRVLPMPEQMIGTLHAQRLDVRPFEERLQRRAAERILFVSLREFEKERRESDQGLSIDRITRGVAERFGHGSSLLFRRGAVRKSPYPVT